MPSTPRPENDFIGSNPPKQDRFDIGAYPDFVALYGDTEDAVLSEHSFPDALPTSSTVTITGATWLSLTLSGIWGSCPHGHQIYHNGTTIHGHVALDMKYSTLVKGMVVEIHGYVRTFVGDELFFLRWKKPVSSGRIDSSSSQCILPFTYSLPEYCTEGPTALKLPPSFKNTESDAGLGPQAIKYRCQVTVPRSKWFQDDVVSNTFHYVPRTRPIQITASRPDDLWEPFTNTIRGTLFGQREVEVKCTLSLSKPLVYSRGSSLSFMLTLECKDPQALDLLSAHDAVSVWLQRNVRSVAPARYDVVSDISQNMSRRIYDAQLERLRVAQPDQRVFRGSLEVEEGLATHYFFPSLSVIYAVAVLVQTTGFISSGTSDDPDTYVRDLMLFAQLADVPEDSLRDKPVLVIPIGVATDPADAALPRWSQAAPPPPYSG